MITDEYTGRIRQKRQMKENQNPPAWVDLKSGMQKISLNCLSHGMSYCQWANETAILPLKTTIQNDH